MDLPLLCIVKNPNDSVRQERVKQIHLCESYKVSDQRGIERNHRDVVETPMSDERLRKKGEMKMLRIIENQKKAEDYMNPGRDHVGLEKNLYEHLFGTAYNEYMRCALDGVEGSFNESPRKKAAVESHKNAKRKLIHLSDLKPGVVGRARKRQQAQRKENEEEDSSKRKSGTATKNGKKVKVERVEEGL